MLPQNGRLCGEDEDFYLIPHSKVNSKWGIRETAGKVLMLKHKDPRLDFWHSYKKRITGACGSWYSQISEH